MDRKEKERLIVEYSLALEKLSKEYNAGASIVERMTDEDIEMLYRIAVESEKLNGRLADQRDRDNEVLDCLGRILDDPIERREDMSPDGKLVMIQQSDGDVIVNIRPSKEDRDYEGSPFGVSVEFCSTGSGGGRSPHTLMALRHLMAAIVKDNKENPIV